jgi:hypothetical protein
VTLITAGASVTETSIQTPSASIFTVIYTSTSTSTLANSSVPSTQLLSTSSSIGMTTSLTSSSSNAAQRNVDYMQPYFLAGIGAAIVMVFVVVLVVMKRRGRVTPTVTPPPVTPTVTPPPVTPTAPRPSATLVPPTLGSPGAPSPGMKFCIFCGQPIPMNARYCTNINCGKSQR